MLVALAIASCKPREGRPCGFTKAICTSSDEALFCEHGKLRRYECRGPKGCYEDATKYHCDESLASVGDPCDPASSGGACEVGGSSLLHCNGGAMTKALECRGPTGCTTKGGNVSCDTSLAEPGDPCKTSDEGKSACTPDHKQRVDCFGGTHVLAARCDGPAGCSADAGTVSCDGMLGMAGAACTGEGLAQCGADGKSVLHCRSKRLVADGEVCLGANGCYERNDRILCDQSIAEEGSRCVNEGHESCSRDGTAVDVCKSGAFVRGRECPHGCTVGADDKGFIAPVRCR